MTALAGGFDHIEIAHHIQTSFGRQFLASLRHQT